MKIHKNVDLSKILWYRIGGAASYLLDVSSREDVFEAIEFIKKNSIEKYFIIGSGSNLLFSDEPYEGAVVRFVPSKAEGSVDLIDDNLVYSFAGQIFDDVIEFSLRNNLVGLEWAGGLPGTVGGAIRGNVGAFGGDIKNVLEEAEVLRVDLPAGKAGLRIENLKNAQLEFDYRTSLIKKNKSMFVVSAKFLLKNAGMSQTRDARKEYEKNIEYRASHHPLEYPTCGSVFKNIRMKEEVDAVLSVFPDLKEMVDTKWHGKVSMGALIGKLGLSGFKVGNAQISPKHNNYIVNLGGATFMDVMTVIRKIQNECMQTCGIEPEVEVEIVE